MASLVLSGDTSGTITVSAPAVSGSNTQTLVATTGTLAPIVSGTAVASTSGTSIDFTSIPSWVKRITVMFSGISGSGTAPFVIQLGDAGGIEITGYSSSAMRVGAASSAYLSSTTGFVLQESNAAASVYNGIATIALIGSNNWAQSSFLVSPTANTGNSAAGSKTLSDTLTQVRITIDGTQTFDAGTINILYE